MSWIALLLLACVPARADVLYGPRPPVLESGPYGLHPYARVSESYESNIFRRPNPVGSWIHALEAGVRAGWESAPRHKLDLGYGLEHQVFTTDPSRNNALNHQADFLYKYRAPSGLGASAADAYVNTVDAPNTEQVDRRRRWSNEASLGLEYAPEQGPLFVGLDGRHLVHRYVDHDPDVRGRFNRQELHGRLKAGYRVLPQTRAYAAYRRGAIRYTDEIVSPGKDSKIHGLAAGLETEPTGKLTGKLEGGLDYRRYDDPGVAGGRHARNFTLAAEFGYRPLERTRLLLSARRAVEETANVDDRYYVATGGALSLRHALPRKLSLALLGAYQRNSYPQSARRDHVYQGRAALDYDIQDWLRAGLSYLYRARSTSSAGRFGFHDHVTGLSLSFTL